MSTIRVTNPIEEEVNQIYIPSSLAARLAVHEGDLWTIKFGQKTQEGRIKYIAKPYLPYEIAVTQDVSNTINLIEGEDFSCDVLEPHTLTIGPVMGILANKINSIKQARNFSYLINTSSHPKGLIYVFDMGGVDFINKTVRGWYFSPYRNDWIQGQLPFPDVIYRQVALGDNQKSRLYSMTPKIFNHLFWFNKWDVYKALDNCLVARDNLPLTQLVTNPEDVMDFFEEYEDVFLKPVLGYLGAGVVRIKREQGIYSVQYLLPNRKETKNDALSKDELLEFLAKTPFSKGYIVQQTIQLARYDGNMFDFRVMVQKGANGVWECTGALARVAQEGNVLTHISHGATPVKVETAFSVSLGLSNEAATVLSKKLTTWCIELAECLENEFGLTGDLGFDIGIDMKARFWFIECNANPDHNIFKKYDAEMFSKISSMPLLYASYLATR